MSTFESVDKKCAVCGNVFDTTVIMSTNAFGYPDLDFRPPEMQRSTMWHWVHRCPKCGYTAFDIETPTDITEEWLCEYMIPQFESMNFKSELAGLFFRAHLIADRKNDKSEMFDSALYAAWACDDAGDEENAVFCRKLAIHALGKIDDASVITINRKALIMADLLRRCSCFGAVVQLLQTTKFRDENEEKIRLFQIKKAEEKDSSCYRTFDALN